MRKSLGQRIDEKLKSLEKLKSRRGNLSAQTLCNRALEACANDPGVEAACRYASLDQNDPMDLAHLLIAFASARFIKGTSGRSVKWSPIRLYVLMNAYLRERQKSPGDPAKRIEDRLAKRFRMKPGTIRRVLLQAADPEKSPMLRDLLSLWEDQGHRQLKRGRQALPDWTTLLDRFEDALARSRSK